MYQLYNLKIVSILVLLHGGIINQVVMAGAWGIYETMELYGMISVAKILETQNYWWDSYAKNKLQLQQPVSVLF